MKLLKSIILVSALAFGSAHAELSPTTVLLNSLNGATQAFNSDIKIDPAIVKKFSNEMVYYQNPETLSAKIVYWSYKGRHYTGDEPMEYQYNVEYQIRVKMEKKSGGFEVLSFKLRAIANSDTKITI